MLAPTDLCENRAVLRHSAMTRATAALLSGLLALSPAAWALAFDPVAQARIELGKAAQLAQKSRHSAAADALQKAISLLTAKPSALDEPAGKLLSDAAL